MVRPRRSRIHTGIFHMHCIALRRRAAPQRTVPCRAGSGVKESLPFCQITHTVFLAALLGTIQSIERKRMEEQSCRICHLSVCVSVCHSVQWVICGKTADWIWMPFGMVSAVEG